MFTRKVDGAHMIIFLKLLAWCAIFEGGAPSSKPSIFCIRPFGFPLSSYYIHGELIPLYFSGIGP
jgi:hypothetical protein